MAENRLTKEIALQGKLITALDGTLVGTNYVALKNLRYTDAGLKGIAGCTKINTTALSSHPLIDNAFHFTKSRPEESHLLVQAFNTAETQSKIFTNDTAIPGQGDFNAVALHTDSADASRGYFSKAPNGNMAYCNSAESCIWGGDELKIGAFVNYDPNGTFKYDYTDALRNNLTDSDNIATLHTIEGGIDVYTLLLLSLNSNVTDTSPTTPHTVTDNNVTWDTTNKKFGTASAAFGGVNSYLTIPDNADFNWTAGTFTYDKWIRTTSLAAVQCLYCHYTDANNWFSIEVTTTGAVRIRVDVAGVVSTIATSGAGKIATNTWYHVEISESGDAWRIFVNGDMLASVSSALRAANYTGVVQIGRFYDGATDQYYFTGNMDEIRLSSVARHTRNFNPSNRPYNNSTNEAYCYVGSTRPIQSLRAYIQTANAVNGTVYVDYWNGSTWTAVGTLVDGTNGLTETGRILFDSTETQAKLSIIDMVSLYWYRLYISNSTSTALYYLTVDAPFQTIKDVWDGIERTIASCQKSESDKYADYTLNVFDTTYEPSTTTTYLDVGSMATTDHFVVGFPDRMMGLHIYMPGDMTNAQANTICTVSYWNGTAWTSVGRLSDATSHEAISLSRSGVISWNAPAKSLEFTHIMDDPSLAGTSPDPTSTTPPVLNQTDVTYFGQVPLYFYKVSFDQTIDADTRIYNITGIPAQTEIAPYKFPLYALGRLFLCNRVGSKPNAAIYSATESAEVFNGDDSGELYFGDESSLMGGSWLYSQFGSSLYNVVVFFKANETWVIAGNSPEDWATYQVSASIGCPSPKTIVTTNAPIELYAQSNRTITIFQGSAGIYIFDGKGFVPIHTDIEDCFDQRYSNSINLSEIRESEAFYDQTKDEYHWCFASGTSATCDREMVYDLKRKRWYEIDRGTGKYLQTGLRVRSIKGAVHNYGMIDSGYVVRLDNGTDFDGNDIVHVVETGDIALHEGSIWVVTKVRNFMFHCVAKTVTTNTVALTHYGDTSATGTAYTLSPSHAGYRIASPKLSEKDMGDYVYHRFKLSMTTDNEAVGFEPLFLGIKYLIVREDTK